jgi:hypothetical protein
MDMARAGTMVATLFVAFAECTSGVDGHSDPCDPSLRIGSSETS